LLLYLAFLGLGVTTPFVMTLGYVWVDTFRPQEVAWFILNELPVALIMGGGAFLTYLALDRRSPPPLMTPSVVQVMMAIWMTATLLWAELPDRAWVKWDWAFKSMVFAAFVPLVIRSRVQIEAFVQTWVFSLAANFVPFGLKVLVSGGGYGQNLGLATGNSGLAEGGQLSTVCLMAVPLILFLGKHGQLIPRLPMMKAAYAGVAILAITTAIGTYERSAIVGLVMLGIYMFIRSRRKFVYGIFAGLLTVAIIVNTASSWDARVASIGDYQSDGSAMTRILVWKWTLGYVATHPLGGSFDAFGINVIEMPPDAQNPAGGVQHGRAYHSIYFEVLGELGWPGLIMFFTVLGSSFFNLIRLSRKCRKSPDLVWAADMSDAVQSGMLVFMTAGAFVGIAFQPPFWYFVSMGVCLRAYVWHAERAETSEVTGWRALAAQRREAVALRSSGWQPPAILPEESPVRTQGWRGGPRPRGGGA
jgi:probable O-glycosylation ligase (exosortase A-associated)